MWLNPVHATSAYGLIILVMLVVGAVLFIASLQRAWKDLQRTRGQGSRVRCPFCQETVSSKWTTCLKCYNDLYINCPDCGHVIWVLESQCPSCEFSFNGA